VSPPVPYRTTIHHSRTERVRRRFQYRHFTWLVDLDDVPPAPRRSTWGPLVALVPHFASRDHLGDPDATLRSNVERFLAGHHVDLAGGRILMLANPRSFGYAFNPLTVFWCYHRDETLACVIAEVQNTYGQRHPYLVRPDQDGRAETDKEFYVSPFFPVSGSYDMRFGEPGEQINVSITLRRGAAREPAFHAIVRGTREPQPRSFLTGALRHPWASWRAIALIRWQGIRLWARQVPIVPRPIPEPTSVSAAEDAVS
jgi:DUF1365 family protein